ncbi:hypothetical protein DQK91_05435 [Oceanidesulfovibrio marinus]|uniref:Uncharacterized protein n=1 Tax=Oceanidesulfovibrio marinus TaxID=370038 RepID=A0A6P1ZKG6_9BACT|nr:hypothetical protein DQK91_05435 [Oceanidesulfovibrio marinus]
MAPEAQTFLGRENPFGTSLPLEFFRYLQNVQGVAFINADDQGHVMRVVGRVQAAQYASQGFWAVVSKDNDSR